MTCFNSVLLLILQYFVLTVVKGQWDASGLNSDLFQAEFNASSMSKQIKEIIEHFKKPDPVGVPGAPIPDPMPTPDNKFTKAFTSVHFKKGKIYGLSKFKIKQMISNLNSLEVVIALTYEKLEILGNYSAKYFFQQLEGGYNITIGQVTLKGIASFHTNREGLLQMSSLSTDLSCEYIKIDFKNLNLLWNIVQDVFNSLGVSAFEAIKPEVQKELNKNIKNDFNKILGGLKKTFPNSIPPLDLAIAEGRKYVRDSLQLDPFPVNDYEYTAGLLSVNVRNISLSGLSSFHRIGNVSIAIIGHSVSVSSHISTQQLEGKCKWEASFGPLPSTIGTTGFTIQYIQVKTRFNQSLDLRKRLILEEMDIILGNFQLRMDGLGTFDYILELMANILPNILRYPIVDALENIIGQRIKNILGALEIEELIEEHVISTLGSVIMIEQKVNDLEDSFETKDDIWDFDALYDDIIS